jgi:hypothetical protein
LSFGLAEAARLRAKTMKVASPQKLRARQPRRAKFMKLSPEP